MDIQAFAIGAIDDPKKVRLLLHGGNRLAHAPLPALFAVRKGDGWVEYADGSIIQWGAGSGVNPPVTFPRPFPNECRHVSVNVSQVPDTHIIVRTAIDVSNTGFTCTGRYWAFEASIGGQAGEPFTWMAWGS